MMTTRSLSHTLALGPNFSRKMPMVPGPQTSWVMRTSTLTQTLSAGSTCDLLACLARIFSVMVMPGILGQLLRAKKRRMSIAGGGFLIHFDENGRKSE